MKTYKHVKYLGNFKEWIKPEWLEFFQQNQGQPRPPSIPVDEYHTRVYQKAKDNGYDMNAVHFWYFKHDDVPFTIEPPFLKSKDNFHYWWMVKMLPAQYMNMHEDPDVEKNVMRYWMPWTDYEPGHVFVINDELITDYKAGDVYCYIQQNAYHGSANIGYTPRYVLQVTEFFE